MLPRISPFSSAYLLCESLTIVPDRAHQTRVGAINPVLAERIRDVGSEAPAGVHDPRELVYFRPVESPGHIPAHMGEVDDGIGLDEIHVPPRIADELGTDADFLALKPTYARRITLPDAV